MSDSPRSMDRWKFNEEMSEPPPDTRSDAPFTQEDVDALRVLAKQHDDDDADNFELTGPVAVWLDSLANRITRRLRQQEPGEHIAREALTDTPDTKTTFETVVEAIKEVPKK